MINFRSIFFKKILRAAINSPIRTNLFLLSILLIIIFNDHIALFLSYVIRLIINSKFKSYYSINIDFFDKLSKFILTCVQIIAILTAGLWAYYRFLRGRIFSVRVSINIAFNFIDDTNSNKAFFYCTITNNSNSQLIPSTLKLRCYCNDYEKEFYTVNNLIKTYLDQSKEHEDSNNAWFSLEPQEEMKIPFSIDLTEIINLNENYENVVIKIVATLTDYKKKVFNEINVFKLPLPRR